jgi:REP element-mobilizing transposase RayT
MIRPSDEFNISNVMHFIKRNFSRNANFILNKLPTNEGDIDQCRLHLNEDYKKFKADIIKFDRELNIFKQKFFQKYPQNHLFPLFKWQKSFHDHVIRNQPDFINHLNYTVYNHLKHNLPENWQYTSNNYLDLIDEIIV